MNSDGDNLQKLEFLTNFFTQINWSEDKLRDFAVQVDRKWKLYDPNYSKGLTESQRVEMIWNWDFDYKVAARVTSFDKCNWKGGYTMTKNELKSCIYGM
jgi:hypothetical protein